MKEEYIPRSAVLSKTHDIHVKSKAGDVDYSHRCIDPSDVEAIPAADVRPVVLCRDCKMRQYCKVAQYLGKDGFCSYGEKDVRPLGKCKLYKDCE